MLREFKVIVLRSNRGYLANILVGNSLRQRARLGTQGFASN